MKITDFIFHGKFSRARFVQEILKEHPNCKTTEERRKILAIAQSRLDQFPKYETKGITLKYKDVTNAIGNLRHPKKNNSKHRPTMPTATATQTTQSAAVIPSYTVTMTVEELTSAKKFLDQCSGSLVKAQTLIKLVSDLTKESIND